LVTVKSAEAPAEMKVDESGYVKYQKDIGDE
jgi:hypothetical protein